MGDDVYGQTRPRIVGASASDGDKEWWEQLIGAGTSVFNTYFTTRPGANLFPVAPVPQPVAVPIYNAQAAVAPGQQIGQGIGDGFSNFAGQFGVTPVTLVLLGIAGVYLFTRK
jgi:hypothetical protein